MKAQERLDRVMLSCTGRMQEEVSALLGKTLAFGKPETLVLSKEDYFSQPAGKTVLAHVQVEGDLEGHGALLVSVKDAIRIGGTLIMLPDSELEAVISEEEYTEELKDSYGEIANIICGSLTVTFDEQYPKNVRLVRTEQEVILPVKVDVDSDDPVPDGQYYLMRCGMRLEDTDMGELHLLLPAATFGLVAEPEAARGGESDATADSESTPATAAAGTETGGAGQAPAAETTEPAREKASADAVPAGGGDEEQGGAAPGGAAASQRDVGKQRKLIDRLLAACSQKVGEEVGALLGGELKLVPEENEIYSKEDLLDQLAGKQLLARFEVRGEGEGEVFLFCDIRDAILLGGTLIMLPEAELEEVVRNEEFSEDTEDAYGEIANIIAGVYTSVFEEQYRRKLGFVKTVLEELVPVKIDPESDETIPNHPYYTSVCRLHLNGNDMGLLHVAFPAALLELEELAAGAGSDGGRGAAPRAGEGQAAGRSAGEAEKVSAPAEGRAAGEGATPLQAREPGAPPDVLIVTDDDNEAAGIAAALEKLGYVSRILHFKDPVPDMLTPSVRLIFLVMEDVSEQGFGVAIKIVSSGCRLPLVAAGPAWTRTKVLKAVKYGACDILITPAAEEDVREKIEANLGRIAA